MTFNFAAYVPLSTIDDYRFASSVIFFRGCDLDCWYCHNAQYKRGNTPVSIISIEENLMRDSMLASSVTLSGGEPLLQIEACKRFIRAAHFQGQSVCLYTNGNNPDALKEIVHTIQRIYIDWKEESVFKSPAAYNKYCINVLKTIHLCKHYKVEINITHIAFDITHDTLRTVTAIKECIGKLPITIIQGITSGMAPLTPSQMKVAFPNCYIRTRENGVELNGYY